MPNRKRKGVRTFLTVHSSKWTAIRARYLGDTYIARTRGKNRHRCCFFLVDSGPGMPAACSQDITELIAAWGSGNEEALNRLMPLVYPDLRRIARLHLRRRDDTL